MIFYYDYIFCIFIYVSSCIVNKLFNAYLQNVFLNIYKLCNNQGVDVFIDYSDLNLQNDY